MHVVPANQITDVFHFNDESLLSDCSKVQSLKPA